MNIMAYSIIVEILPYIAMPAHMLWNMPEKIISDVIRQILIGKHKHK